MAEVLESPVVAPVKAAEPELATVAVVGLGYVGLPVAVAFGRERPTIGYDLSKKRIENLRHHVDATGEVSTADLMEARELRATSHPGELEQADVVIVAVPTPINAARQPDLSPLESASETVGRYMKRGAIVVYESTVYPGATEEVCVPILEKASGMRWKQDFHVGYSPERINPGDREHTFTRILKIVSGDDAETLEQVAALYASVVKAGVHRASSIRVAEAAKVIENTQRDLNIAFVNELAIIFERMGLDTLEVLKAAGTKWNFLPFRPGLVGGHCIGVDPYYLTHKAELMGYHPEVILAGRRINDSMGSHIARKAVQQMIHAGRNIKGARVNVLGPTFKEDVPDIRNSKELDIIRELPELGGERPHPGAAGFGRRDLRARPGGLGRRGAARVRRAPHRVGRAAGGGRRHPRRGAQQISRDADRGAASQGGALRLHHRCQVRARRGGPAPRGAAGVAPIASGALAVAAAVAPNARQQKLRVGVFADSPLQPRWAVEALDKLAASDFAHVRVVEAGSARAAAPSAPWRLYGALDRKLFGAEPTDLVPLTECLASGPDSELDVAFVLGAVDDSRLDGIARYGVWRFCFGAD